MKIHSVDTLIFIDGTTYIGNLKNGMYHGKGTLTWADGQQYSGEWVKGVRQGYGIYTWPEKRYGYVYKYEGYWKNGDRNGRGTAYYVGGSVDVGIWENNILVTADSLCLDTVAE